MRAVEEGLPLIRAANSGISAIVDAYGRSIIELGLDRRGVLDGAIPANTATTIYSRARDVPFAALLLLCLLIRSPREHSAACTRY